METPNFAPERRIRWIFIVPLTIVCLVGLLAVAGVVVAHNIRVHEGSGSGGDGLSIDTPAGSLRIRKDKVSPASLGVPTYPGAQKSEGKEGSATFSWSSDDGKNDTRFAFSGTEMFTHDSADKVVDFYRAQLPNWLIVTEESGATRFELKESGIRRIIAIRGRSDGTHIGVATVGEPASN